MVRNAHEPYSDASLPSQTGNQVWVCPRHRRAGLQASRSCENGRLSYGLRGSQIFTVSTIQQASHASSAPAVKMPIADRLLPPLFGVHVFWFSSAHWVVTMVLIPRAVNSIRSGSSVAFSGQ